MITVSALYPSSDEGSFDRSYYLEEHIPMVVSKLGNACTNVTVEFGSSGVEPGSAPPYVALARFGFESVDAFLHVFSPNAAAILGDIPNFTNIAPAIQVNEVALGGGT